MCGWLLGFERRESLAKLSGWLGIGRIPSRLQGNKVQLKWEKVVEGSLLLKNVSADIESAFVPMLRCPDRDH